MQVRSYFENEGDTNFKVSVSLLEDEIPNLIKMSADDLPTGNIEILPGTEYTRLNHIEFSKLNATASEGNYIGNELTGNSLRYYKIEMPILSRTLTYVYEDTDIRKIVGWTDSYPSAFDKKPRTTIATLKAQKWLPYWNMNSLEDANMRKELGIK